MNPHKVVTIPGKGRGVVAARAIRRGHLVEVAPVIVIGKREAEGRTMAHYVYCWGRRYAVALGVGSLFNHSARPTLYMAQRPKRMEMSFFAARDLKPGEELTIDYGYTPKGYVRGS